MAPAALPNTASHSTGTIMASERNEPSLMSGASSTQLLRGTQERAARARIGRNLSGTRAHLLTDDLEHRFGRGRHDRQARQRRVDIRTALHELFDDAILERVEAHDRKAPARCQHGQRRLKSARERRELIIDEDPQRLESTGRGMFPRLTRTSELAALVT